MTGGRLFPRLWTRPSAPWAAFALVALGVVGTILGVDLSPRVEGDFFFAPDDPQMAETRAIEETFPDSPQVLVRAERLAGDEAAFDERVSELTDDLLAVEGIEDGWSPSTVDVGRSPLYQRVLIPPDEAAVNIVVRTDGTDPEALLPRLEAVLERHRSESVGLVASGVPVIVERIRRALFRDLVVFSAAAILVFGTMMSLVYRDPGRVAGTLLTCLGAVAGTLLLTQSLGLGIGLLTANLVTIVFVLTLSHTVFLTGNWVRAGGDAGGELSRAVRDTFEGSLWSMVTTLLGFLSLTLASARPLQELGAAGAVGTLTAMGVAYTLYPAFLGRWARRRGGEEAREGDAAPLGRSRWPVGAVAVAAVVLGTGILRLDTDPGLLDYFAEGTDLREGLERIDRDGGSSPLEIVVRDPEGRRLDEAPVVAAMDDYQAALEDDPAVGVVLSPAILLDHARTQPLAGFLSDRVLLDLASSPRLGSVALGYVTEDRLEGRFSLRMREASREGSRDAIVERVTGLAREAGLEPVRVGGLWELQARLADLLRSSLAVGIGGLLLLFSGIALAVARAPSTALVMVLGLTGIPLVVLGTFGHLGVAVDIITSPAANIALALGVDSMLHLVVRVRRFRREGLAPSRAWAEGLARVRAPVLTATAVICGGFGIFVLSTFPPTRRFGMAVILGTLTAALMTLVVVPRARRPSP